MAVSLSDLRSRVRSEADMVNSQFVSDDELKFFINESTKELFEFIVGVYEGYFIENTTVVVPSGANTIDMSSLLGDGYSIYKLHGVDRAIDAPENWATLSRFNFANRNRFNNNLNALSRGFYASIQYDWVGNIIRLIPKDSVDGTYQIWYSQDVVNLVNDEDTIKSELERWSEYIVVDAAIKCKDKEESDTSVLMMRKQAMTARVQNMAPNRDAGSPARIASVRRWANGSCGIDGERY